MAGFKGQAKYSVDSKGRITIPAKMRSAVNPEAKKTFTVTRGFEQCVFLYPMDVWSEMEEEVAGLSRYSREARDFVRIFMRWADEVTLDAQGRIKLPNPLIDFGNIDGEGLIIGALDHVEIWNPDIFENHLNEQSAEYETLAEHVMGV